MPIKDTQEINPLINLNHRSEIEDIIGHPPGWILYWGITVVFFLMIVFGLLASIIKYPDVLSAPIVITMENPVIKITPEVSGRVEKLFVKDRDLVTQNQPLLLLESKANWNDVHLLNSLITDADQEMRFLNIPSNLILGNMQSVYTALMQQVSEYQNLQRDQSYQANVILLEDQIRYLEKLNVSTSEQVDIFTDEVRIVNRNYKRKHELFESGAASESEVEEARLDYLNAQRQLENLESQILNNQIRIKQLRFQIANIIDIRTDRLVAIKSSIQTLTTRLKNEINIWEKMYLIKAPIGGILSLSKIWSEQQFIEAYKSVCTIIPKNETGDIIVRASMPAKGIGKIKVGTKANIKLTGFPEQEYGILKAAVKSIGIIPERKQDSGNSYMVELSLEEALHTSYGKIIPLQPEMEGMASLITEEKSILQRVINQSLHFLKNN